MKHKFLFLAVLLSTLFTTSLWAQTPGYAIYGDVPYGYEDLTSKVTLPAAGSVDAGILSLTGTGLPGRFCENNYLSFAFNEAVTMTLTENYAIHVVLKRAASANNVQLSLCKNGWNAARASFELPAASISADDYADVTVAYGSRRTDNWNSYGESGMINPSGVSFPAAEMLRISAANSEVLYISQIYIDADATSPDPVAPMGDTDAPESLTLAASNIVDKSVTLTASATDENSPISYTFYYKASGDADFTAVPGAVSAASGADAVKVVTGLAPETTYSFKVVATDPSSNAAETTISGIETLAAFKNRFYFFRAGEIPEIEGVNMVDLRESVGTTFQLNNMDKTSTVDYIHYALKGSWFSFNQNLSASTDMAIVEQSTWYLCIKMRTNLAQTSYNLRLNNAGECWMISSSNLPLACDGSWETLALPLSTSSKTLNFTAAMTGTIFQMHANGSAASDYIDIAYAYLTDDPLMDEKPAVVDITAPANFSVAEKAGATTHNTTVLQLYAEDEDTPITYTISYKVKGSADEPMETSINGTQGTTVEKEITGLTPETTYAFTVVASDPNGNETSPQVLDITTTAFVEKRYYLFRGEHASVDMPSGIACVDLRNGVGTGMSFGNSMTLSESKYYSHFAHATGWWSFNQNLSAATNMSEITQADWYLVVKFRTNYTDNSFNIRLLDAGECYQVSQSNLSFESDGTWNTLTLALADSKKALNFSASQTGTVFQFHANNGVADGYLDIAYAYLTNLASSVDDLADNTNPVISALSDGDKTTSSVVLNVTASDDSGEALTYIIKESETVLASAPASGASGAETAITVSGLDGVNHTLTVIAQDGAGNQASQNIVVTLPAANEPPYNLFVSTVPASRSIEFTMSADDDNSALIYAILDENQDVLVDNIAGTAGSNTVYVLKGLTPETDYTFYVRVTDNADAFITSDAINETTTVLVEHRFYLMRGDNSDLPSSATLESTLVECNLSYGNGASRDSRAADYLSVTMPANWTAVDFKPVATVTNEIDDEWYIVVRMRNTLASSFDFNRFRLNLSNGAANWQINNSDSDKPFGRDYNDGEWIVLKKKIGERRAGTAVPASYLVANQIAAQIHIDNSLLAGERLDIDYIYFTDDITSIDEGTMSGKRIAISETEDNTAILTANDGQTVEVDLTRSLTNASYNTFCVPFDLSAEQVEAIFGAGTTIGKLGNAHMKDGDELYLGFEFVDAIEAGVPYIIQPANEVANPLIAGVTINKESNNTVVDGVITFKGVISPELINEQSAEDHSILLLAANNTLSWPNATANIKGMRAYFESTSTVAHVARRARFGFESEQTATGIDQISNDQSQITNKVVIDGQLIIIRDGVRYNVMGTKLQ